MPSSKAPAYQRGKYNVKRKSPKTTCPICNKVVFSRGLNSHIKIGHSGISVNEIMAKNSVVEAPEPTKLSEGGTTQLVLRNSMLTTLAHYTREELQDFATDLQTFRDRLEVIRTGQSNLFAHIEDAKDINRRRFKE